MTPLPWPAFLTGWLLSVSEELSEGILFGSSSMGKNDASAMPSILNRMIVVAKRGTFRGYTVCLLGDEK